MPASSRNGKFQMDYSIQITVDTCGHLAPGGNTAAVDRLDDPELESGNKWKHPEGFVHTIPSAKSAKAPDLSEAFGSGPPRDRTEDPLIKSQLLYQLS